MKHLILVAVTSFTLFGTVVDDEFSVKIYYISADKGTAYYRKFLSKGPQGQLRYGAADTLHLAKACVVVELVADPKKGGGFREEMVPDGLRNKTFSQEYAVGQSIVFTASDEDKEKGIKKGDVVKIQFMQVFNFAVKIDEVNADKGTVVCRKYIGTGPDDNEYGDPVTLSLAKDCLIVDMIPNPGKGKGSREVTVPDGLRNKKLSKEAIKDWNDKPSPGWRDGLPAYVFTASDFDKEKGINKGDVVKVQLRLVVR